MTTVMKKNLLTVVSVFSMTACFAQQKVLADKISGIVGDKIVLKSDAYAAAIADTPHQGLSTQDECQVFEQMLTQKTLALQAEKDSLPVSDEDIDAELDLRIRYFIEQYHGKEAVEKIAGKTLYQLKEDMRAPVREQLLASAMRARIFQGVTITPAETKEYYDRIPKDEVEFLETRLQVENLRDDYSLISQRALDEKKRIVMEKWLLSKIPGYYVRIDGEFKDCGTLAKWQNDIPTEPN